MATPTSFIEQNDTFTPIVGDPYPVWIQETTLGEEKTIDVISGWQLSPEELAQVRESGGFVFLSIIGGQPPCCILSATAVPFEGQNTVYTHPDCYDLAVFRERVTYNGKATIRVTSAWQLSPEWLAELERNGGIVFLRVVGGQPPVEVAGINPIL